MSNLVRRIVFMGSSEFSLASLKKLCETAESQESVCSDADRFEIVGVYTRAPKPTGRNYKITKTVVHQYAEEKGVPVFTPKTLRNDAEVEIFSSLRADFVIVSSYGLIIPAAFLEKSSFINIHGSLLPRWRGASPIQSAILAGDKETGISIMKMDEGLDTGDIISMKSVSIDSTTTFGELSQTLADLGADMICEFLRNPEEQLKQAYPQPEEGSCYAAKITKEFCQINPNDTAVVNLRKVKAFSPSPSAWLLLEDLRIKILDAALPQPNEDLSKDFVLQCADGVLRLDRVHPAGKNPMSGRDFIRGYRKR